MSDLLKTPVIGPILRWRHSRTLLQIPLLIVSLAMIVHGFFGPTLAPKNLATTLSWVHFRGALVLVLLCAGNFFCMACPFMLVRNALRKLITPRIAWPRALRNKWLSIVLFIAILYAYELYDLWSSPFWTAWLIVGYFLTAVAIDSLFKHATFCKFICPIGQFNFIASLLSPREVTIRSNAVCNACATKDCIRGRRDPANELVTIQSGCQLALFQPLKTGNMDCTFCLECVQACPHDNVGILSRLPAAELMTDPTRSGIGRFSQRRDIAALAVVFTFGALLNAFGMVSPVYAFEKWLGALMHATHEAPVLAVTFALFLLAAPLTFLGSAALMTKNAVRFCYAIVPMGFGMWLAHYSFHFLTGFLAIPGLSNRRTPGLPVTAVQPIELGFLLMGLLGSLFVCWHLTKETGRPITPWLAVCAILFAASIWLMFQPMEMRGLSLAG